VNGGLDAILIDLEKQDRLQKSGRGLVGMEEVRRRAESS
jgi:N utilization substance protein B